MRTHTNIYKIANDILSITEEDVLDIICLHSTFGQDDDENDKDFDERIEKEIAKIKAQAFRKIADILEMRNKE